MTRAALHGQAAGRPARAVARPAAQAARSLGARMAKVLGALWAELARVSEYADEAASVEENLRRAHWSGRYRA
ncbi:MAG TPA: hypothetical protein VNN19_07355 [bacterium]|nr:hypothetical protein [bacterium]